MINALVLRDASNDSNDMASATPEMVTRNLLEEAAKAPVRSRATAVLVDEPDTGGF
jgi:hypothetical protein